MRLFQVLFCFVLSGLLVACGSTEELYSVPQNTSELRQSSQFNTIEVSDVQLPDYAATDEIWVEQENGALTGFGPLWADDPGRTVTHQLAQNLGTITGSRVAADPWPFRDFAEAKVSVRVSRMHATISSAFIISGQYFVVPDEGDQHSSGNFDISVPIAVPNSAVSIAAARATAVTLLAEEIAQNALP